MRRNRSSPSLTRFRREAVSMAQADIGLFQDAENGVEAQDVAVRRVTELLAASVQRLTLPCKYEEVPRVPRVLVFGRDADQRAQYIAERNYFSRTVGSPLYEEVTEGVFWVSEYADLGELEDDTFDAVLVFNMTCLPDSEFDSALRHMHRLLLPGGVIAGTGVFMAAPHTSKYRSFVPTSTTTRELSMLLEECGMEVATLIDLSLEGNVLVSFEQDVKQKDLFTTQLKTGKTVCARFLAVKTRTGDADLRCRQTCVVTVPSELKKRRGSFFSSLSDLGPVIPRPCSSPIPIQTTLSPSVLSSSETSTPMGSFRSDGASSISSPSPSLSGSYFSSSPIIPATALPPPAALPQLDERQTQRREKIVVSGVSLGLPNALRNDCSVFDQRNFKRIFEGENCISLLTDEEKQRILDQNIVQVTKVGEKRVKTKLNKPSEIIQLASKLGHFDLKGEYGVPQHIVDTLDTTYQLALAAGLEALKSAGISVTGAEEGKESKEGVFGLPKELQDETGVIFASSFPCMDSCVQEVTKSARHQLKRIISETRENLKQQRRQRRQQTQARDGGEDGAAFEQEGDSGNTDEDALLVSDYEYDRKLLFRLLVLANNQLAELIHARGPNTHVNSACASTTQAIAIAEDWIRLGRCKRVIVISADNATGPNLLPYIGTGFLALTAASTAPSVEEGALPFDKRRNGMILGMGAVGMVLESQAAAMSRNGRPMVEILGTHFLNSAFHATLIDNKHISAELSRFIDKMAAQYGFSRGELARDLIYFSHETFTCAKGGCAKAEMDALQYAFGAEHVPDVLVANTKGFTGHPMGVGLEDVIAAASLDQGLVPPLANYKEPDPCLGNVQFSKGGTHTRKYALRFSAGFGNQFVFILMKKWTAEPTEPCAASSATPTACASTLSIHLAPMTNAPQPSAILGMSGLGPRTPSAQDLSRLALMGNNSGGNSSLPRAPSPAPTAGKLPLPDGDKARPGAWFDPTKAPAVGGALDARKQASSTAAPLTTVIGVTPEGLPVVHHHHHFHHHHHIHPGGANSNNPVPHTARFNPFATDASSLDGAMFPYDSEADDTSDDLLPAVEPLVIDPLDKATTQMQQRARQHGTAAPAWRAAPAVGGGAGGGAGLASALDTRVLEDMEVEMELNMAGLAGAANALAAARPAPPAPTTATARPPLAAGQRLAGPAVGPPPRRAPHPGRVQDFAPLTSDHPLPPRSRTQQGSDVKDACSVM